MFFNFRKLFFVFSFNTCLFLILIIGIQNSAKKSRVNLLLNETIILPISFIVGSSFISGSLLGSFLTLNFDKKKQQQFKEI